MRRAWPVTAIFGALALAIGSIAVIIWMPVFVGFGLAIVAAVCWCIWLERHPLT